MKWRGHVGKKESVIYRYIDRRNDRKWISTQRGDDEYDRNPVLIQGGCVKMREEICNIRVHCDTYADKVKGENL